MNNQTTESKAAFSRRIGRSKAYVSKLIARGLPLTQDGKSVLIADALAFIDGNVSTDEGERNINLNAAKARLALANAKRAEFALECESGRYVSRDEVKRAARAFGRAHRDAMLGFANRYGASIAAAVGCDPASLIGELEARMREALLESVGIPTPFQDGDNLDDMEILP